MQSQARHPDFIDLTDDNGPSSVIANSVANLGRAQSQSNLSYSESIDLFQELDNEPSLQAMAAIDLVRAAPLLIPRVLESTELTDNILKSKATLLSFVKLLDNNPVPTNLNLNFIQRFNLKMLVSHAAQLRVSINENELRKLQKELDILKNSHHELDANYRKKIAEIQGLDLSNTKLASFYKEQLTDNEKLKIEMAKFHSANAELSASIELFKDAVLTQDKKIIELETRLKNSAEMIDDFSQNNPAVLDSINNLLAFSESNEGANINHENELKDDDNNFITNTNRVIEPNVDQEISSIINFNSGHISPLRRNSFMNNLTKSPSKRLRPNPFNERETTFFNPN